MSQTKSIEAPAVTRDKVYHLTGMKRIGAILTAGLNPNADRGEKLLWRETEKFLDAERPQKVIDLGISRLQAVYAHPDIDMVENPNSMGAFKVTTVEQDRSVALSIVIERPDRVLVGDAWLIDDVQRNMEVGDRDAAKRYALNYWNQTVTLEDYRRFYDSKYERIGGRFTAEHVRSDAAPDSLPYIFFEPEVLIPGPIDAGHLEWTASALMRNGK